MGIEKFFNTIHSHSILKHNIESISSDTESIETNDKITKCNNIYFDFNSLVYNTMNEIEREINYILYEIVANINTEEKLKHFNKYADYLDYNKIDSLDEFNLTLTEFKTIFTSENMLKLYILVLKDNLNSYLTVYNDKTYVKHVFISFDGTPNMPKIVEQRKRKYMQYVIGEIKKRIMDKYSSSLDETRKLFEDNKVHIENTRINTENITSENFTSFIKFIYSEINSDIDSIKLNLPNLETLTVSPPTDNGEGEKKIIEHIFKYKYGGDYLIISPDADVIILALIQKNMLIKKNINTTFKIIKKNPFEEKLDIIDIDKLNESLKNHLTKRITESMTKDKTFTIDIIRVMDDICFLLTMFGNDFIPKIKSLNIRNGFNVIFEVYVRHLTRTRNRYRYITFEEDSYKINYDNLNSVLYKLSENEHKLCYETYAASHYKNYSYINSHLEHGHGSPYFFDKINAYVHGFNKLMTHILANRSNPEVTSENIYDTLLDKYTDKEVFLKQLLAFEGDIHHISNVDERQKVIDLVNKIMTEIKSYNFYRNKLHFIPYSTTINDKYHQKILKEELEHPNMTLTQYDIHMYKLDKKLDEYYHIFNSDIDNTLGFIDVSNRNGFYKLLYDTQIENNINTYYEKKMNIKTKQDKNKLAQSYLTGMFWTFDFYFNKNDIDTNKKYISIWSYEYDSSPFIKDIIIFLEESQNRNKLLNHIFYAVNNILSVYHVSSHLFMNDLEQYIYVTPMDKLIHKLPKKYDNTIIANDDVFPNMSDVVSCIIDGHASEYIDCGKSTYLNKCTLLGINKVSHTQYMKMFIGLRN